MWYVGCKPETPKKWQRNLDGIEYNEIFLATTLKIQLMKDNTYFIS